MKLTAVLSDLLKQIVQEDGYGGSTDIGRRDKWFRILREDGFDVDESTGAVRTSQTTRANLTDHALNALEDPASILDHLHRLGNSVDDDPAAGDQHREGPNRINRKVRADGSQPDIRQGCESSGAGQRSTGVAGARGQVRQRRRPGAASGPAIFTLTQSVTEIRNQVGIDHGAEEVPAWVRPRHARLVVGAAQVWCQLMLETLADPSAPWRRSTT